MTQTKMTIEERAKCCLLIADEADANACTPDAGGFMRDTATVLMILQIEVNRLAATLRDIANAPGLAGIGLGTTFIGTQVQRWAAEAIAPPGQDKTPESSIILPNG